MEIKFVNIDQKLFSILITLFFLTFKTKLLVINIHTYNIRLPRMIEKVAKKMDKTFSTSELNISSGHVNQVFAGCARLSRGITGPSLVQY